MNANAVAKRYGCLTPEERFRLILAASGRGDHVEGERLARAGPRLTLSMPDHAPYAEAFQELALLTFIELLEEAAFYQDANARACDALDSCGGAAEGDESDAAEAAELAPGTSEDEGRKPPAWERSLRVACAIGYMLRAKGDGWKLFCERMTVPPFLLWEGLPGFDRLQRALALSKEAACGPEGFLRWLNTVRPAGEPKLTEVPLTVEKVARATEEMFRRRVAWWSG